MHRSLFRTFSATILVLLLAGSGSANSYKVDPAHSSVEFSIRHIVSRVTGSFTDFSGSIMYDPEQVEKSTVEATIQIGSIDTRNEKRDNHLGSPDFFDTKKYPEMSFKSTGVKKQGDKLLATGDLTLHGVTKSVVLTVEVLGTGVHPMSKAPVAGFAGETVIKRSDYGVNNWTDVTGMLGDEVRISLNIEAAGTKGANPCNPCGKNPCNPCNPCGKADNPCNPCGK